ARVGRPSRSRARRLWRLTLFPYTTLFRSDFLKAFVVSQHGDVIGWHGKDQAVGGHAEGIEGQVGVGERTVASQCDSVPVETTVRWEEYTSELESLAYATGRVVPGK